MRRSVSIVVAFLCSSITLAGAAPSGAVDIPGFDPEGNYLGFDFGPDALYVSTRDGDGKSALLVIDPKTGALRKRVDLKEASGYEFKVVDVLVDDESV